MFYFTLVVSLILLAAFTASEYLDYRKRNLGANAAKAVIAILSLSCALSQTLFLQELFCFIIWGVFYWRKREVRFRYFATATAFAYLMTSSMAFPELRELSELKQRYPMESLAPRLTYEKRTHVLSGIAAENSPSLKGKLVTLDSRNPGIEEWLSRRSRPWSRTSSFRHIHSGFVNQFINSPGFGIRRMPLYSRHARAEEPPIPFPVSQHVIIPPESLNADQPVKTLQTPREIPSLDGVAGLHETAVVDFADPDRYGFVTDLDHVAGFLPHQFSRMPGMENEDEDRNGKPKILWTIERLELVSLLKFDKPAVYLSEHLPRMQDLRDALTRPLDSFENAASHALQQGKDLEVESGSDSIRMMGSIRAFKKCQDCHQVETGDLLGAFSYKLRLDRLEQKKRARKTS